MMIIRRYLLCAVLLLTAVCGKAKEWFHYMPHGGSAVCVDGEVMYNRALYGAHSGFRMECSDMPVFGIYLPGMGGNLSLGMPDGNCKAVYTPGRMDYEQGGVTVEAQVSRTADVALWRVANTTGAQVSVTVRFGGVSGKKFYREGDLGVDSPDCFALKPEYCTGNVITVDGDIVYVEYGAKERKRVTLVIPASDGRVTDENLYEGSIILAPGHSVTLAYFPSHELPEGYAGGCNERQEALSLLLGRVEKERRELASTLVISTPDEWLNPVGGALAVAADGIWSGKAWLHGSIGWRTPHLGWRGAYCGDALGWHDRAQTHFETYADNQITDIPAVTGHPCQDEKQNLARARKKWGTPMYSNGYICRRPGKKTEMSHYDMNLVYADALLRHFKHTGDTAAMRRLFPVLRRHLDWERLNFDPDGDHLYDAYCCIWASDALYYSGGAVTHSSAYNCFANELAGRVARMIGEDSAPYFAESQAIREAVDSVLWMPDKGCWAEFREYSGSGRVHPYPALWTVYHAIDSDMGDEFKRYAATRYVDREIPRIPLDVCDTLYTISTTNWKPYSWSINNVAIAEVMHTALAYWQADRADEAYRLMKGVAVDNMYSGASPLNFGQISRYDAARGECYRDFADPIGVWSRAVTEGLYGIRPDMLGGERRVVIRPGFPREWDHASVSLPELSYSFERDGDTDTYVIENRYAEGTRIYLHVPALGLSGVFADGDVAEWVVENNAIGEPRIVVTVPYGDRIEVKVRREASREAFPTGNVRTEGPVRFEELASGVLKWWSATDSGIAAAEDDIFARASNQVEFEEVDEAKCEPVDISPNFNASVDDIFRNRYLSPRPQVTTLQIPVQGIGEWCHPKLTAEIDDSGIRRLAGANGGRIKPLGIPFSIPEEGNNVIYTSLWDNYPDSASVALSGKASHLYLLMVGSTNHMLWGMENVRLTVRYADGSSKTLPLVPPVNWAPVEQDFYTDSHAFRQPAGCLLPMRVHLHTGEASRSLGDSLGLKGPADRMISGGAAVMIDLPLDADRSLEGLDIETVSHDVVAGIMAVSLQRP